MNSRSKDTIVAKSRLGAAVALALVCLATPASAQSGSSGIAFFTGGSSSIACSDGNGGWWLCSSGSSDARCDTNDKTPRESLDCKLAYWKRKLSEASERKAKAEKDIEAANERIGAFTNAQR